MNDVPLYSRGPYRVVHLRKGERPYPWVVVDTASAWLHEDATFEAARDWVDRRETQRVAPPMPSEPQPRGRR